MSAKKTIKRTPVAQQERFFARVNLGQRGEHALLSFSGTVMLLTELPQKCRDMLRSHDH